MRIEGAGSILLMVATVACGGQSDETLQARSVGGIGGQSPTTNGSGWCGMRGTPDAGSLPPVETPAGVGGASDGGSLPPADASGGVAGTGSGSEAGGVAGAGSDSEAGGSGAEEQTLKITGLAYGGRAFVATGLADALGSPVGVIFHSVDGVHWSKAASDLSAAPYDVEYGNGHFVALGPGVAYVSGDGERWDVTEAAVTEAGRFAFGNGLFVAESTRGVITSEDGMSWKTGADGSRANGVEFANGRFVRWSVQGQSWVGSGTAWEPVTIVEPRDDLSIYMLMSLDLRGLGDRFAGLAVLRCCVSEVSPQYEGLASTDGVECQGRRTRGSRFWMTAKCASRSRTGTFGVALTAKLSMRSSPTQPTTRQRRWRPTEPTWSVPGAGFPRAPTESRGRGCSSSLRRTDAVADAVLGPPPRTMHPTPSPAPDDWNQHWDAYAETAGHNPAQAYRRKLIFERLKLEASSGARVLELGSGQGDLSSELVERAPGIELLGLDISHSGIGIAREKVPGGTFVQQDFMQPFALPERYHGWATHAVCSEVLEHVADPRQVLMNARRCLAPGARFVITVPAGPRSAFDRHIGHRRHFTPGGLENVLTSAGLEIESVYGAGFPFFNLYRLAVVARGEKLIADATQKGPLPLSARATIRMFSWLFELNRGETPWGWQLVAVAREPGSRTASGGREAA